MFTPVDDAIRGRRTSKVTAAEALPPSGPPRADLEALFETAGWAPFHRPAADAHRSALPGVVPWRFYALDAAGCRALREALAEATGPVPSLLATADALVLVTWLPDPPSETAAAGLFEPTLANMEHVAAAGAAVQNLLVASTARGIRTFWSSGGGILRQPATLQRLGIGADEVLLGSVFLFPAEAPGAAEGGTKLREQRGPLSDWMRWVEPDAFR
ncbi:MAG TPA: nitroreductase family protein [Rubricoccaceae bacterium]